MPLPKQLRRSASKKAKRKRVARVMRELKNGPVNAPSRKATSGEQRHRQDVAIALKNAGASREDRRKVKRTAKRATKRKSSREARRKSRRGSRR